VNTLSNVYCLGCKDRHESVTISQVSIIKVRGSPRHQAKGTCENGRTWCKLLKATEVPEDFQDSPPNEDESASIQVFEKGAAIATAEPEGIEEPEPEPVPEVIVELEPEPEVIEEPEPEVIEEPEPEVIEEPEPEVIEEPEPEVIEEPEPEPVPEVIHSFDIPIPTFSEEPEKVSSDESNWEDEGGSIAPSPSVRVRPERVFRRPPSPRRRYAEGRRPQRRFAEVRPPPPPPPPVTSIGESERAKKIGGFMGRSMANAVGEEYVDYTERNWERTKIPDQYYGEFEEAYLEGGLLALKTSEVEQVSSPPSEDLDGKTIAGIAGLGILAAWIASQMKK